MNYYWFAFLLLCWGATINAQVQDSSILTEVDIPPLFEGCDDPLISEEQRQACSVPKIQAFINQNIIYPDSARIQNIEGVVVVRFSVTKEGAISDLELIRTIGAGCGQEAMRVVRMMPNFRPALRDGKPVATKMTLPIRFKKTVASKTSSKNLYQVHWGTIYQNKITKEALKPLLKRYFLVRDYYGNTYDVRFLTISIATKGKELVLETKGNTLSREMLKTLKKVRVGQVVEIRAMIQKEYEDIEVVRELELIK